MKLIDIGASFAPNDLQLLQSAVIAFVAGGETARAVDYANRMVELDPLNSLSHRRRYYALFYDRQYDACIAEAQRTLKLSPGLALPPYFIALSLLMKRQPQEAQHYLEMLPSDLTVRLAGEAIVAARLGNRVLSDKKLDELKAGYGDAASYQFAQVYAQRGEAERAFAALERGFAVNDPGLNTLSVDPLLDPLHSDRRFDAMTRRVDAS